MQMTTTFDEARYGREVKARLHDMAVMGDPLSGPAFGQFEKSKGIGMIIGVIASVVTMGAALPMLASTVLATQIAGGIMFAGGALSGIGAVTGNKKLQKIGGVMSLAGGIGALASNAANAAGAGGAFASGSGSTAVQNMAGTMMESVNSVGGAVGFGDVYDKSAVGAASTAGKESAAVPGGIDQSNISNLPPADATAPVAGPLEPQASTLTGGDGSGLINKNLAADSTTLKLDGVAEAGKTAAAVPGGDAAIPAATPGADSVTSQAAANNWQAAGTSKGGILNNATNGTVGSWVKDNSELLKLSMSAVEKGATAAMQPDQQAYVDAIAAKYGAEASALKTQQEILAYQQNNMSKQVAMISADDPDIDNKVKNAAANKVPVVFIPAIGAGGIKQNGGAFNAASGNMAQQPARQATFGQQPAAA